MLLCLTSLSPFPQTPRPQPLKVMIVPVHKGIDASQLLSELREMGVHADVDTREESLSKYATALTGTRSRKAAEPHAHFACSIPGACAERKSPCTILFSSSAIKKRRRNR